MLINASSNLLVTSESRIGANQLQAASANQVYQEDYQRQR